MRRVVAVAVIAAGAVGCSSEQEPAAAGVDREAVFLEVMREREAEVGLFEGASDARLLDVGHAICELHRTSPDRQEGFLLSIKALTEDGGLEGGDAGFVHGAAVGALCPEYQS